MANQIDILKEELDKHVGIESRERILQGCDGMASSVDKARKAAWWKNSMDLMDSLVDEGTRTKIMEQCGWQCAWRSRAEKIRVIRSKVSNMDDFYLRLQKLLNPGVGTQRDGFTIYASYPRCYCGRVSATKEPISITHCHCSKGYFVAMFTTALARPVQVDLLQSIINGADSCRFAVHIPEDKFDR